MEPSSAHSVDSDIGIAVLAIAAGDADATIWYAERVGGTDINGTWVDGRTALTSWQRSELVGDLDIRLVASGSALVFGARREVSSTETIRFLHLWQSTEQGWQLSAFHETPVAADGRRGPRRVAAAPKGVRPPSTTMGIEKELVAAERERREIFAEHSAQRYEQIVTPDYASILVDGAVQGLAARASAVTTHFLYDTNNLVVEVRGSVAVVRAEQTSADGLMRITRVWVNRKDQWLVAAHAGTLVAEVRQP